MSRFQSCRSLPNDRSQKVCTLRPLACAMRTSQDDNSSSGSGLGCAGQTLPDSSPTADVPFDVDVSMGLSSRSSR